MLKIKKIVKKYTCSLIFCKKKFFLNINTLYNYYNFFPFIFVFIKVIFSDQEFFFFYKIISNAIFFSLTLTFFKAYQYKYPIWYYSIQLTP